MLVLNASIRNTHISLAKASHVGLLKDGLSSPWGTPNECAAGSSREKMGLGAMGSIRW